MAVLNAWSNDLDLTLAHDWDTIGGTISIAASAARNGAGGILIAGLNGRAVKNITNAVTLFFGFAMNVQSTGSGTEQICAFLDGGTIQVDFRLDTSGHLIATRNGTVLGTSSSSITFGVWHYIETKVTIDPTTGVAEIKVDGTFFLQLSGQNTRASANSFAGAVQIGGQQAAAGWTKWHDDLYLLDASGAANNTYLGDSIVKGLLPQSNGTTNQFAATAAAWSANTVMSLDQQIVDSNGNIQRVTAITSDFKTGGSTPAWASTTVGQTTTDNHVTWTLVAKTPLANWMYVDEPSPDDDQSYVFDATLNDVERYLMATLTAASIFAVGVKARASKDNAGPRSFRFQCKSGATTSNTASDIALSQTVYGNYQAFFETDPNTAVAWTQSGVNAAEFGVKLTV